MSVSHKQSASWVCLLGISLALPAAAAEVAQQAGTAVLEEVVVTAQRREENLQSVPISVSTVSAEDLKLRGADSLQTLAATVPGFSTSGTLWVGSYIRGVGSTSASPNNEPSVATYVDGVYNPSSYALMGFAFNNIERIEVLKGPQGTLFGRNASGGVVQIITGDPKHELGGKLSVGYGNYQTAQASGYVTGGVTDTLAADFALNYEKQGAGWGTNFTTGTETYKHENIAARSKWLFTPSDLTKVNFAIDYSKFKHDGYNNAMLPGSFAATDGVTTYVGEFNATGNDKSGNDNSQTGASVRIDHDFTSLHGASITAYRKVSANWFVDNDNTANPFVTVNDFSEQKYWTQEFQLSNQKAGRIEWLVGAFFYRSDVDNLQRRTGTRVTPGGFADAFGHQKIQSASAFGQATAELLANTRLTLGLRYTDESLELVDARRVNQAGATYEGPFASKTDYAPWTWRVALDHQFKPDVLGYISWNRGFKSGGYNLTTPTDPSLLPEQVDAYELGLKTEFLDHRVRLNLAAFYYDYTKLQISVAAGGGGQVFLNGAARNKGFDAGLDFAATDRLTLSVGVALLQAKYTDYPGARTFSNRGVASAAFNAAGWDLPNSPPFSGYISGKYRVPTSFGDFRASVNLAHTDETFVVPANQPKRAGYDLLSASVEWWSKAAKPLGLRLWGKNLTNEYYGVNVLANATGWHATYAPPRTFGLTLLKDF